MADGVLRAGYEALERGDAAPLLDLLGPSFEWIEPSAPGYPLGGVHRGASGVASGVLGPLAGLLEGLTLSVDSVVVAGASEVVTGVMRGRPAVAASDWELPFAHVWTLSAADGGVPVRCVAYFDRSRLTLAAGRRRLADVADDLLDQTVEIRQQWARLGDALRAAGVDAADSAEADDDADEDGVAAAVSVNVASARLVAVDMAAEGSTREEVDEYLREELGVEDTQAILDEAFDPTLFVRNRS